MIRRLATFAGALAMLVGVPAATLYVCGQLDASAAGYALGFALGIGVMVALMAGLQRIAPDQFVLEVALVFALAVAAGFVAWLALRGR